MASLQPDDGGRRQIFAKQAVLARLHALARNGGDQLLGLLLGQPFDCPETGTKCVLIEALGETAPTSPVEGVITAAIAELIRRHANDSALTCVGWYSAGPSAARLAPTQAAIHTAYFKDPWQTALVVADDGGAGAFFLRDALASRWFHAPFHEVTEQKRKHGSAKPTCTAWPTYLTTGTVDPFVPVEAAEPAARHKPVTTSATSRPQPAQRVSSGGSRSAGNQRGARRTTFEAVAGDVVRSISRADARAWRVVGDVRRGDPGTRGALVP